MPPTAISIGIEADRALSGRRSGRVEAVFDRALYVRFDEDWVCIGAASIGRGPLNVTLPAPVPGAALHGRATVAGGTLTLGDFALGLGTARLWRPRPPARRSRESLAAGLKALIAALPDAIPPDGLGAFIRPGAAPAGPVARAAAPAVAALSGWLAAAPARTAPPGTAVRSLLGLGPGLTPSGDDYLAGMLAALRLIGRGAMADALWAAIDRHGPELTGAISFAHLRAANRSGMGEMLHDLTSDTIAGRADGVRSGLAALSAAGHNSPWDALAGSLAVLSCPRAPGPEAP